MPQNLASGFSSWPQLGHEGANAAPTEADLLDAYPRLTRADIQAAIGYAVRCGARSNKSRG